MWSEAERQFMSACSLPPFYTRSHIILKLQVNIAVQTYELVDKQIRKLDSDLAKFESEMKVGFVRINISK